MPQLQLPVFPEGTTAINDELAFQRREDRIVYLNGHLPVFTHTTEDLASFRLFTTQLIVNGTASQGEIVKAFGVPLTTVKRCCRLYRERGASAFFKPASRRCGHRLTAERLAQAQQLLDEGQRVPAISAQLNILTSTLHKAIDDGRLKQIKKKRAVLAGAMGA
jgi:transposase